MALVRLQFRVQCKAMLPAAEKPIEPGDLKMIDVVIKAGIPQSRLEKRLLKYDAKKYLLTLLQSGQFGEQQPSAPAPRKVFDTKAERLKLIEQFMAQKRGELNEMFHEMPDDDQQAWIVRFEAEALPASEVVRKAFRTKGIASQIVRPLFFKFLGNAVWEEGWDKPTDSDLVDLAILTKEEGRAESAPPAAGKLRL
ncbi:hypothetical protein D3870_21025 [Noviherbaspirillum cavernae]|uniref:Uncharacterized protein n=1 Tax=Noviherbaspirillum cavernae TaxID=2320862 RepID=A0A418WW35_9BURK|nr:hypothetical protein [Noviherbaspirillum cavernae]RJF96867.1 hypothetical protein D3870_21025 [Noviherbaspirillum cavernae]